MKRTRRILIGIVPLMVCATFQMTSAGERNADRQIGSRLELFTDNWLIADLDHAAFRLHPPVRREVVFSFDAPWEGGQSGYGAGSNSSSGGSPRTVSYNVSQAEYNQNDIWLVSFTGTSSMGGDGQIELEYP